MAVWNLVFYVYPNAHLENNRLVSLAVRMNAEGPTGAVVYYGSFDPDDWYFAYFNPQTVWKPVQVNGLDELGAELESIRRQGRTAWIDITGLDLLGASPLGKRWLAAHSKAGPVREPVTGVDRIRFSQLFASKMPSGIAKTVLVLTC